MEKAKTLNCSPLMPLYPFNHNTHRNTPILHILALSKTCTKASPVHPSLGLSSVSSALNHSTYSNSHSLCKKNHTHIMESPNESDYNLTAQGLFHSYIQTGNFRMAASILCVGFGTNALSWSRWLAESGIGGGNLFELLKFYIKLHSAGDFLTSKALIAILKICSSLMDSWVGLQIHGLTIKRGFGLDAYLNHSLMDFYADSFGIQHANRVFNDMPVRNAPLWRKVIALNAKVGSWLKVIEFFRKMQFTGEKADSLTIAKVVQACRKMEALKEGKQIHGYIFRSLQMSDVFICNCLISMYSSCSKVEMARIVFDSMDSNSLVSWNSMISGYALNGFLDEAWELFDKMSLADTKPDTVTWNSLISGCSAHGSPNKVPEVLRKMQDSDLKPNSSSIASALQAIGELGSLELGKEIHCYSIRNWLERDTYVGTSLMDMYIKSGCLKDARKIFDALEEKNIFAWNLLISAYAYDGLFDETLEFLNTMEKEGLKPDLVTWNGLISGYAMRGHCKKALVLIRQLRTLDLIPNVISWTALISGCCRSGNYLGSFKFFTEMQKEGISPNAATLATLLRSCAGLSLLLKGGELHCQAIRNGFDMKTIISTALVDMYCKSGSLSYAHRLFRKVKNKNLASWNSMIMGFAVHGFGREAISLFHEMRYSSIQPDGISLTAVLSGCRFLGSVDEGWKYFDSMTSDYGITPTIKHYTCMVDLLGRSGYLDEAWDLLQNMPFEPDASAWGALLGACRLHNHLELAEIAFKYLIELEPHNSGNFLLMMSIYANQKRWNDVETLRDLMRVLGTKVRPSWSWMQIANKVHVFASEGKPHPQIGVIYFELYQLIPKMRKLGYEPVTNCSVLCVDEEDKEKALLHHTEKLAITYGLINTGIGMPIRVISNTRVCDDCHTFAKYLSQISDHEIILRDCVRFHHFVGGRCTCSDYW